MPGDSYVGPSSALAKLDVVDTKKTAAMKLITLILMILPRHLVLTGRAPECGANPDLVQSPRELR
jgi:hypothetical protein